ncbi:outer membrane protein assembly factor BamB family protein [Picrophilus oshimae]|uniref:Outer membrane protein assembly factor BamB, contains PQQ-like beta-propeller repeat n=1 Tax=Picrophilus torridus (strain ATCC 700027 / DSM 9790 / JCM 10055 / NBRC 100828 / KAW 2/3) TaxID=1122961 RepID=A0A8G2L8N8_PICTO|nr:PQQ-binding-like beta-propeller repeat protein [Picrophilus oshimae]SMD31679.1 Outer membrane protein assembly factor BamB, contains PQQ-like beta-propeller repeat [Picrophilus oshimae DSM 9789]
MSDQTRLKIINRFLVILCSVLIIVAGYYYIEYEDLGKDQGSKVSGPFHYFDIFIHGATSQFQGNDGHVYLYTGKIGNFAYNARDAIIVNPTYYNGEILIDLTSMSNCTGGLLALNASNGHELWCTFFPNQVMTQPIVHGNLAFVGLGNNKFQSSSIRGTGINYIAAVNITNGNIAWKFFTTGEDMPTPVYYNGLIIEPTGGDIVYGLNASTGSAVWSTSIPSYVSMSSPAILNGIIYFGGANPYIFYAINATNGNIVWEEPVSATGGLDDDSPVIFGNSVVTGYTETMINGTFQMFEISFNITNGAINWITNLGFGNQPAMPPIEDPPQTVFKNMILDEPTASNYIYAINPFNGSIIWKFYTGMDDSNANIYRGLIFTVNYTGEMFILNYNGHLIKKINTGIPLGPGNIIFVGNHEIIYGMNGEIKSMYIPLKFRFYHF